MSDRNGCIISGQAGPKSGGMHFPYFPNGLLNVCVLIMSLGFEKIIIIISRVEASFSEMKSERTLLIKSRII